MRMKQFLTISSGLLTVVCGHLNDNPAQIVIAGGAIIPETTDPIESWLNMEIPYAFDGVLNNIGPDGAKATGAGSGIVIASPSHSNPDCKWLCLVDRQFRCLVYFPYDGCGCRRIRS